MSRTPAKTPEQSIAVVGSSPTSSDEAIRLHATGHSRFICDEPTPDRMCYVEPVVSPHAHARIRGIDATEARRVKGVVAVLTAHDIPGENQIGVKIKDEPLLPEDEACYIGQPTGLVVAATRAAAKRAAAAVRVDYEPLEPILTIADARRVDSLITAPIQVVCGDVESTLTRARHVLEGEIVTPLQEHVYFETQRVRVIPGEGREILLQAGTQSPSEVQQLVARVLGLSRKDVSIDVRRLGGAFGGKESAASLWCCLAALASRCTGRPIELCLSREQDMAWTGKRHNFESLYRIAFDDDGRIEAYNVEFHADAGAYSDLTMAILQRAVLHAENCYHIPILRAAAYPWRTHLPPNTAFRGFGAPQGIFVIESLIERIARAVDKDPIEIRRINAYRDGQSTHYGQVLSEVNTIPLLNRLEETCEYRKLRETVSVFNRDHRFRKRGLGVVPVKFGISFTTPFLNQGSALVHLFADGSASVSHGGVEMGQGVNVKVARVVADELGLSLKHIRIESHNTRRTANTAPTAASTGADINGNAARVAARKIVDRLRPVAAELLKAGNPNEVIFRESQVFDPQNPHRILSMQELATTAWQRRVDLSAHGFYQTPGLTFDWRQGRGTPFAYYVHGCGLVLAEVDILTGNFSLVDVHLIHETARSVDPLIDRGQIEGAFIQGMGWCTIEEVVRDDQGRTLTDSLTTYKIPAIGDLPQRWTVEMVQEERRLAGLKGSKAVGEPPFIYGEAAFFAIKHAVESVAGHRFEADLRMPATPESILRALDLIHQQASVT